ncbi:thioredoxin domain-containing protein [Actinoplanes sp. TBRC 11911]|uniref:Na+/H+ antiporter NhaA n=1 Tax=Actinoplanes sp. TBRC 11911 TaxID=2729386 RepID=UPI00145FC1AC|nr:Na+/H+ antiporter NhaA [Actinoplanes sp. TBRC 11911]NMO52912.1 thioredoxin domain-containing protein [Actinoplanes sp. TBRC 11911]
MPVSVRTPLPIVRESRVTTPVRGFLVTQAGSAAVLVAAIVVALTWTNFGGESYERFWHTDLSILLGDVRIGLTLQQWVNSGLMTLFFLVVGLEARREFDLGDLRDRRRFALPAAAGVAGMVVPVGIFLAINHGGPGLTGWGVAMSTDTALALGLLALVGRRVPDQTRLFLVTVSVVDDVVGLIVTAVAYTGNARVMPLVVALLLFALTFVMRRAGVNNGYAFVAVGVAIWFAILRSGVDPVVSGLALGLTTAAYTPMRGALERATDVFRSFREQPTPELARFARMSLVRSLSPNDRLQRIYTGWTSYLIVPLFGLANAGIAINVDFLRRAVTSPITIGVFVAYVVGKPIAVAGVSTLIEKLSHGRIRAAVGWASVLGSGTIAGMGFTVSFLIANHAFRGTALDEAKLGVLAAIVASALITWVVFRVALTLAPAHSAVALLGDAVQLTDLIPAVDDDRDHTRGPADASVTIVEYGDFQCKFCGRAAPAVGELQADADLRVVWRHLPLTDVHPQAQMAAQAAEAAAVQGKFWQMHDLLLRHQAHLRVTDLVRYAAMIGLDTDKFHDDMLGATVAARVAHDVDSADLSGVAGTPTFFINGRRHYGEYDVATLQQEIRVARKRASIVASHAIKERK